MLTPLLDWMASPQPWSGKKSIHPQYLRAVFLISTLSCKYELAGTTTITPNGKRGAQKSWISWQLPRLPSKHYCLERKFGRLRTIVMSAPKVVKKCVKRVISFSSDMKPYTAQLSLTACNESSFACDTGQYIAVSSLLIKSWPNLTLKVIQYKNIRIYNNKKHQQKWLCCHPTKECALIWRRDVTEGRTVAMEVMRRIV